MTTDNLQAAYKHLERVLEACEGKDRVPVLKEMIRFLEKHSARSDGDTDRPEDAALAEIRGHLEPLGLAPEGTSLPELARLAALAVVEGSRKTNDETENH